MLLIVPALLLAVPAGAVTESQYASGWTVNNNADWTPFPPSTNPLGPVNDLCTGAGAPVQSWAEFTFPAFSIPAGATVMGIEVRFNYLSQSGSNTAQLTDGGSLVGATRTVPQQLGDARCSNTVWVSSGGAADLWGTAPTAADFNAGSIGVRLTKNANTLDLDALELVVHHDGGVANTPPTAEAGGPYMVNEGGSVGLSGAGSTDTEDAPGDLTYEWDLDDDGSFETAGSAPTFSAAGFDGPSMVTVTLRVTDTGGLSDSDTATVQINNVAPTVDTPTVSPEPSDEGESVTASATFSDPADSADAPYTCTVDHGDGSGAQAGTVAGDTCTGPAHTYADDGPYTVTVEVTDDDGGTGDASSSHGVDNVAPEIGEASSSAEACSDTPEGGVVEVEAAFSDPGFDNAVAGTAEDFTASTIDWGDGTVEPATVSETPGGPGVPTTGSVSGSHVYAGGGVFTITVTVEDDDGGSDSVELIAIVTGAGLNGGELQVVGTDDKDVIQIQAKKGGVEVHSKLLDPRKQSFPAEDVDSIRVLACGGDDQVHLNRDLDLPAIVDGGSGNDHLMAGSGPAWLSGGPDDDHLFGGPEGDLLEGGEGNDHLFGRGGDDLLDGGPGVDDCKPGQEVGDTAIACEV